VGLLEVDHLLCGDLLTDVLGFAQNWQSQAVVALAGVVDVVHYELLHVGFHVFYFCKDGITLFFDAGGFQSAVAHDVA